MIPSEYTPSGTEQAKFSPADILFKYLAYLPLFILTVAASVGIGIIYLRYITPKYQTSTQLLVKSGEENKTNATLEGDLVETAIYGPREINMPNELQKLRSLAVITRSVEKNNFHISYFNEGNIKTSTLHTNQVNVLLKPITIIDSNQTYRIKFTDCSKAGFVLLFGEDGKRKYLWSDTLNINGGIFKLEPSTTDPTSQGINIITWIKPSRQAASLLNQLSIRQTDPFTTIVDISIKNDNPYLGADILNSLVAEYNIASIEYKNDAAKRTIQFIDQRIDSLGNELKRLENDIELFSNSKEGLPTIELQASEYKQRLEIVRESIEKLNGQTQLANMVYAYMAQADKKDKPVPSSLGITDPTLSGLIVVYNLLQAQRVKDLPNLPKDGLLLQQLDSQIEDARQRILESLQVYKAAVAQQLADQKVQETQNQSFLALLPNRQKLVTEIERTRKVKESIYLYLLQRREATALTTASTRAGYEQLNPAPVSSKPIEPDEGKIRLFAILIGILLPIGIIYVRELLNDKLYTRDDILKKTRVPIIGEIGHVDDNRSLVVAHQSRNIISEQFRIVRSNLGFFMKGQNYQTILVTSTVSGEGKSFISINLAAVLALSGKRVALLEFDLRRPRIMRNLGFGKSTKGIANILLGLNTPEEVFHQMEGFDNLHIYPSGFVAPNPGELVLSESNRRFFDHMKANYDFIIIDSAPVGLVSDTFSLSPFVDTTIYILRHRFSYKRQVDFVQEVFADQKLPKMWLVVNDLKMGARFGYYGYGYGYGKGYGYGYSYYTGSGKKGSYFSDDEEKDDYYDVQPSRLETFWLRLKGK